MGCATPLFVVEQHEAGHVLLQIILQVEGQAIPFAKKVLSNGKKYNICFQNFKKSYIRWLMKMSIYNNFVRVKKKIFLFFFRMRTGYERRDSLLAKV